MGKLARVWDGSEWVPLVNKESFAYQSTPPTGAQTGDIWVDSDSFVPSIDTAVYYRWRKTVTGGQTSLSGVDDASLTLQYTPGYEQLFLNGILMVRNVDYTATTGTTITGLTALVANDVVEVLSPQVFTTTDVYTQTQSDARFVNRNVGGLSLVVPTSVTGGTVSANGAVTIGSAVSSVTVNGAFSATYDAYKIIITGGSSSSADYITLKLGNIATGYYQTRIAFTYAGIADNGFDNNTVRWTVCARGDATNGISGSFDLLNPFLTKYKFLHGGVAVPTAAGTVNGVLQSTTSVTDFTMAPPSGTITGGTIRIYGYNNGA